MLVQSTIRQRVRVSDDARFLAIGQVRERCGTSDLQARPLRRVKVGGVRMMLITAEQIEREQQRIERVRPRTLREQQFIEIDQQLIESARKRVERESRLIECEQQRTRKRVERESRLIECEQQRTRERVKRVKRDQKIVDLRVLGFTLQKIGDQFDVTRERVRQICNREQTR